MHHEKTNKKLEKENISKHNNSNWIPVSNLKDSKNSWTRNSLKHKITKEIKVFA